MPPAKRGKGSPAKRKLSSLSSFQPTLNFGKAPARTNSSSSASTQAKSSETKLVKDSDDDSKLMPPPPVPSRTRTRSASGSKKGKEKAGDDIDDSIEIIDSDDEVSEEEKAPRKKRALSTDTATTTGGLWTDAYAPTQVSELAPGKQRVAKVAEWLYEAVHGVPESVGKSGAPVSQTTRDRLRKYRTTTVRVVAKELGIDLSERSEGVEERGLGSGFAMWAAVGEPRRAGWTERMEEVRAFWTWWDVMCLTGRGAPRSTPTFITKALNRVLSMAIQDPALRPPVGAIQLIAQSNGDLRSAINSLQMLSSGKSLKAMAKKRKTDAPRAKATGRGSRGGKGAKVDLSDEIRTASAAAASSARVSTKQVTRTDGVDASTFALWLHSNIPKFCEEIEEFSAILDEFGLADLMRTDDDIVTKPQFFESYRTERDNGALLDVAAGYMARKAVASHPDWPSNEGDGAASWGGMASRAVLATELVPMAVKIQHLTNNPLLPISVRPLTMPPYVTSTIASSSEELTETSGPDASDLGHAQMAGEDGMGDVPERQGWDTEEAAERAEDEELGWLEDDDIEDWD
ncbi:RAD17 isoform 4 [Trichosporon asahii var. asahii CBS 2479]|uniref:RAD17 isoform 4 n=1 Tax=Trichosporon asahii var. asahii (strain ATCC 90039 / CBS 2479 / JCM 2466 / KCTC 7840 / NBRC 103889/ NCYC 2677 / UAMH 7654) TaxID=1186058 RepID=J6F5N7_TRIAS|nr:RAD17 isoform 4 [Trichosporon asahii var. asahii CBS 2479]EJT50597.1 RAD17 isoform 4 [Trichosporon asahii var. asahii CBS 2479]